MPATKDTSNDTPTYNYVIQMQLRYYFIKYSCSI